MSIGLLPKVVRDKLDLYQSTSLTIWDWLSITLYMIIVYASTRVIYLLYFHPLSAYPGPKIAAVSNVWYAYHWIGGRYAWAIEETFKRYGDVVRIAPNELAFLTPQAATGRELFTKTNFQDLGEKEVGFSWETDPEKHRAVAKQLHPAFAARTLALQEPLVHEYIDLFIDRMKEHGTGENGIELNHWLDWLALDISADLTYSRKLHQIYDMKPSSLLTLLQKVNFFGTITQITKKFPLLKPAIILFLPPSLIRSLPSIINLNRNMVKDRLSLQDKTTHPDFFSQLCPPPSSTKSENLNFLGAMIGQIMIAGYDPVSNLFYASIYYLLHSPQKLQILVDEVRGSFQCYEGIDNSSVAPLQYLHAVIQESLRLYSIVAAGPPRRSPGAVVDGSYIPAGVIVQTAPFARHHSPRYFHNPQSFHPERWLPSTHKHYNPIFKDDDKSTFWVFGQGVRSCPGIGVTWLESKVWLVKMLWVFDVMLVKGDGDGVRMEGTERLDRERRLWAMWERPELWVRFVCVERS